MKIVVNPVLIKGSNRVLRGSSWHNFGLSCRSANRLRLTPGYRFQNVGFRVAVVKRIER